MIPSFSAPSAHSTERTSLTKSKNSFSKQELAMPISLVTPYKRECRSQRPPTVSRKRTSSCWADGEAMQQTFTSTNCLKRITSKNYYNSMRNYTTKQHFSILQNHNSSLHQNSARSAHSTTLINALHFPGNSETSLQPTVTQSRLAHGTYRLAEKHSQSRLAAGTQRLAEKPAQQQCSRCAFSQLL